MKIEIPDLTAEECGDIAVTAAEGGIGYWSIITSYDWRRWLLDPEDDSKGNAAVPDDFVFYEITETEPSGELDPVPLSVYITPTLIRNGFERGLAAPKNEGGWAFSRLLSIAREDWTGEIDSETADLIVQLGVYGKVVWG